MSGVARLVAKIGTEMGVEVEQSETPARLGMNPEHLRMAEALLFAASEPLDLRALASSLSTRRGSYTASWNHAARATAVASAA